MNPAAMTASLSKPLPRLMLTLLVVCTALHSAACHAQTHYVYRFAFTPPEQVFRTGFQATGNDLNMLNYLGGTVAGGGGSGFVSVTANYDNIQDMATTSLRYAPAGRSTGYIYRISADSTFYDVNLSVRHFFELERQAGMSGPHRSLMRSIQVILPLESSQRLVATHGIAPGMIQWVVPVSLERGADGTLQLQTGVYRDNPGWVGYADNRTSSQAPYPITWPDAGHVPSSEPCAPSADAQSAGSNCTGDVHAVVAETLGIEGALRYYSPFDFADCSSSSSRDKRHAGEAVCAKLPVINVSRKLRVLDVLLGSS